MNTEITLGSQTAQSNLYPHFLNIKSRVNDMLKKYKDKNFLEDTSIDIKEVAYNIGIQAIIPVPPIFIQYDHSHLTAEDIILLNKDDEFEHQF